MNYGRELRMGVDIRRKEKIEKATKFVKRMKKVHKEVGAILKKAQECCSNHLSQRQIIS